MLAETCSVLAHWDLSSLVLLLTPRVERARASLMVVQRRGETRVTEPSGYVSAPLGEAELFQPLWPEAKLSS